MLNRGFRLLLRIPMSIYCMLLEHFFIALQSTVHTCKPTYTSLKKVVQECMRLTEPLRHTVNKHHHTDLTRLPRNPTEILRCHLGHVREVCVCVCVCAISLSPQRLLLTLPQKTQQQKSCFPYEVGIM